MRLFETTLARIAAALCLALLVLLPQAGNAQAAYPGFYRIVAANCNLALDKECKERPGLHNENGKLELGQIQPNWWSAQWEILGEGGQFSIRNRYTGEFLAATLDPALGAAEQWKLQLVKPDTVITSFSNSGGVVQTRPAADLQESMVWNIVSNANGETAIVNSAVVGLRDLSRVSPQPAKRGAYVEIVRTRDSMTGELLTITRMVGIDPFETDGRLKAQFPAFWLLQSTGEVVVPKDVDIVRIFTAGALTINIETGTPAAGEVAPGWLSAQWVEQAVDGGGGPPLTLFRNVWTSKYLGVQNGSLTMMDRTSDLERQGFSRLPYAWHVTGANGPHGFAKAIKNPASGKFVVLGAGNVLSLGDNTPNPATPNIQPAAIWAMDDAREAPPPPPPEPDVLVRLLLNGDAVNVETGPVQIGPTPPNFWSGDWIYTERVVERRRLVSFRNRWQGKYLMIRDGAVVMADPANPEVINDPKQMEEMWQSEGINGQALILRHLRTGLYLGVPNKGIIPASPTPTATDKTPWRIVEVK